MAKEKKELRDILPASGIWTVEDFANYMGLDPQRALARLSEFGVKVFHFSKYYRFKLFRLEDLKQ